MIDYNAYYQQVFEEKYADLRSAYLKFREVAEAEYEFVTMPKTKKKKDQLTPEQIEAVRQELLVKHAVVIELDLLQVSFHQQRRQALAELAGLVTIKPVSGLMYRTLTSSTSSYRTQGYGNQTYAKGVLLPIADKLAAMGVDTHIQFVSTGRDNKYAIEYGDYYLWANIPTWAVDAVDRTIGLKERVQSWTQRAINPMVYYPFLPPEYLPW